MKHLLLLLFLLPLFTTAQRIKTKIDKLTGDTIVYTTWVEMQAQYYASSASFFLQKDSSQNSLYFETFFIYEYLPKVRKDALLKLKLSNGEILTLQAMDTYECNPLNDNDLNQGCRLTAVYALDDHTIALLKSYPVVFIRFYYNAKYKDYEIRAEDQSNMMKVVKMLFK